MLRVIKKDGGRENFSRAKVLQGLTKACYKRPVSTEMLNEVVDQIERDLHQRFEGEVPSSAIGEMVMTHLRSLDDVAFIRFASVYREFKDVSDFVEEAGMMLQKAEAPPGQATASRPAGPRAAPSGAEPQDRSTDA